MTFDALSFTMSKELHLSKAALNCGLEANTVALTSIYTLIFIRTAHVLGEKYQTQNVKCINGVRT